MEWSLYDARGRRKYLVPTEREAFLRSAMCVGGETAAFCAVLVLTGARISEALALTPERIDDENSAINLDTLKRRRRGVVRAVPVPRNLLDFLDGVLDYRTARRDPERASKRLWSWSRTTAWRRVKAVIRLAATPSHVSKPRSVRHAFGAAATIESITLSMIQKWLGHADIRTTAIYATVIGKEERTLARRAWRILERQLPPTYSS